MQKYYRDLDDVPAIPDEVREYARAFARQAGSRFDALATAGYEPLELRVETDTLIPLAVSLRWRNRPADRGLDLTYFPFDAEGRSVDRIGCLITKLSEARQGLGSQHLLPAAFLRNSDPAFNPASLNPAGYSGPFEERVDRALAAYEYYLSGPLYEVVSGREWMEGYGTEWT